MTPKEIIKHLTGVEDYHCNNGNLKDHIVAAFDLYPYIPWTADSKKEYEKIEAELYDDSFDKSGDGWEMYCWHDVSGFEYWMVDQQEPNYVQISILFTKEHISQEEINKIDEAFAELYCHFKQYENIYSSLWDV